MQEDSQRMQRTLPAPVNQPVARPPSAGAALVSGTAGFLQAVGHQRLVTIAASSSAVITLVRRPGHFIAEGETLGFVFPPNAASAVSEALERSHIVGSSRTLTQDLGFAIDQLVEIAIRALSPAVNDTFTALNCIDWLGDCLCRSAAGPLPLGIYHDRRGVVRLVEPVLTVERLIKGATDKIREAASGMPAIYIRQLENFKKIVTATYSPEHQHALVRHADMILQASERTIQEASDRRDVRVAYDAVIELVGPISRPVSSTSGQ